MEQEVLEYFEAYFGGQLNESTSDEDIMNAVYDLIDLTEAVLEATALSTPEGIRRRITRTNKLHVGLMKKRQEGENAQIDNMKSGDIDKLKKGMDNLRKIDKRKAKNQDRNTQAQQHRHDAGMPVTDADVVSGHRGWHPDANFGTRSNT